MISNLEFRLGDETPRAETVEKRTMPPESREAVEALVGHAYGRILAENFSSLRELAEAGYDDLAAIPGLGPETARRIRSAVGFASDMQKEPATLDKPLLDMPARAADVLRPFSFGLTVERFFVMTLNTRRRLIRVNKVSDGTLDTLLVHPREVFRTAILQNAHSVIVAHTHPSGDPLPSEADVRVTRELIAGGKLLKIELCDHIIMGTASADRPRDYCSLRELGHFA